MKIKSTYRKKHQRAMNKAIHKLNKELKNSPYPGIYVYQFNASWMPERDGTGHGELCVALTCFDKETGIHASSSACVNHWLRPGGLDNLVNWFIAWYLKGNEHGKES